MFQYQIVILTLVRFDSLHEDNEDACQPPFSQSLFKSQFATVPYTFLNLALIKPLIDLVIDLASRTPPVLHPSPNAVRGKKKKKESEFYVGSWNLERRLGPSGVGLGPISSLVSLKLCVLTRNTVELP